MASNVPAATNFQKTQSCETGRRVAAHSRRGAVTHVAHALAKGKLDRSLGSKIEAVIALKPPSARITSKGPGIVEVKEVVPTLAKLKSTTALTTSRKPANTIVEEAGQAVTKSKLSAPREASRTPANAVAQEALAAVDKHKPSTAQIAPKGPPKAVEQGASRMPADAQEASTAVTKTMPSSVQVGSETLANAIVQEAVIQSGSSSARVSSKRRANTVGQEALATVTEPNSSSSLTMSRRPVVVVPQEAVSVVGKTKSCSTPVTSLGPARGTARSSLTAVNECKATLASSKQPEVALAQEVDSSPQSKDTNLQLLASLLKARPNSLARRPHLVFTLRSVSTQQLQRRVEYLHSQGFQTGGPGLARAVTSHPELLVLPEESLSTRLQLLSRVLQVPLEKAAGIAQKYPELIIQEHDFFKVVETMLAEVQIQPQQLLSLLRKQPNVLLANPTWVPKVLTLLETSLSLTRDRAQEIIRLEPLLLCRSPSCVENNISAVRSSLRLDSQVLTSLFDLAPELLHCSPGALAAAAARLARALGASKVWKPSLQALSQHPHNLAVALSFDSWRYERLEWLVYMKRDRFISYKEALAMGQNRFDEMFPGFQEWRDKQGRPRSGWKASELELEDE